MNWAVFNVEENPSMDEMISLCNTMPFLSEKRVVVVRNAQKLNTRQLDQLMKYLDNPCDMTTLILIMEIDKPDKELSKYMKKFEGKARIARFESIRNISERISWIMSRALLMGKIDKDARPAGGHDGGSSMCISTAR
jgi:DNA polymerase-3 subunit delta